VIDACTLMNNIVVAFPVKSSSWFGAVVNFLFTNLCIKFEGWFH
jgi:hypothetical protein